MNADKEKMLLEKYMEMPEEELIELAGRDETEYEEGVFPLLAKAVNARLSLSRRQRILSVLLPVVAGWYCYFAPTAWKRKEAFRFLLIGLRNYLLVGLVCYVGFAILSDVPVSTDETPLLVPVGVMLGAISVYLFFQKKKL
jgi:hypothetical protein